MKKVILSLVFVIATGSMMNANTSLNPDEFECAEFAWNKADEVNSSYKSASGHNYSSWDMWELTSFHYEECMGN
jgi:hypothetical protein